jgi:hypothetical protein
MKIILSRKGFDSGYGGYPSPILPNGEMVSIPIPVIEEDIKYNSLHTENGKTYETLMADLYGSEIKVEGKGKHKIMDISCHLDPDIKYRIKSRENQWRGLFGQAGSSQSHLMGKGVDVGDVFLFFGWFQHVITGEDGTYALLNKQGFHAVYGYLQVGEIYKINEMLTEAWMGYHPHVKRGISARENDYVYVASKNLSLIDGYEGYGTFTYNNKLKLTKDGYSRSRWNLPEFMKDVNMSYHSVNSWKEDYFQSAAKGQEFVIDANEKVIQWAKSIIESGS